MSFKNRLIEWALEGKFPLWVYRFFGSRAVKTMGMEDDMGDAVIDTKSWWKSKTILSDIVTILIVVYQTAAVGLVAHLGHTLPAIPEWVFAILGGIGIYGRATADKAIG